jgi:hypothetical protein
VLASLNARLGLATVSLERRESIQTPKINNAVELKVWLKTG